MRNQTVDPAFNAADKDVLGASDNMKVSFIGVPIRVDANVVGTLTIDRILDNKSGSLLDYDLRLPTTIANLVGQIVKLHRLFQAAGASIGRNDFDCCHGQCFFRGAVEERTGQNGAATGADDASQAGHAAE
nr:GAF domain-containing protein [Mesorhizobium sp. WSM3873]